MKAVPSNAGVARAIDFVCAFDALRPSSAHSAERSRPDLFLTHHSSQENSR
jgi:hypothetical protein